MRSLIKIRSCFRRKFKKERVNGIVNVRIKGEDGVHVRGKEKVKGV